MKVVIFGATGMVFDLVSSQSQFVDVDACFFCLGVSSVGVSERAYHHLTYDLTLAAATALASVAAPRLTFCYVSSEGTDSTEHGRVAWARTKGETENVLLRLPIKATFMFRPGYIQPLKGIRSNAVAPGSQRRDRAVLSPLSPAAAAVCDDNREYRPRRHQPAVGLMDFTPPSRRL
jgi:uncharacterized protein YbjT (DUF2867 family)